VTIADPVCAFYTSHPYPPPVENLDRARDEWQHASRHRAEHHLLWPARPYQANLDILVAGCGTWQAAKYALCRPAARVAGIDVSATSIEHTATLQLKYNLTNLELRQLPIEQVDALERRFDGCAGARRRAPESTRAFLLRSAAVRIPRTKYDQVVFDTSAPAGAGG
jgi:SAM-dependent methyltransferase